MVEPRVLIAYASRYGTTETTANDLAQIFNGFNITTDLVDLKSIKEKSWPDINSYNGIIVGSGIRIGKWMKEPQKFLKKIKMDIENSNKVLGIFVSCTTCLTDPQKAKAEYLEKIVVDLGLKPDIYKAMGPILDFSETTRIGRIARAVLKKVAENDLKAAGFQIDFEKRNDLRDPTQIHTFAENFANLLKQRLS
ncbi:MAG: flavodoxin domain-containing protein [Candidatus Helarchaeota archaeon]